MAEALPALRLDLERLAPDDWASVLRSILARQRAVELLTTLARAPSSYSRLGWELRLRLSASVLAKEAA